MSEQSVLSEAQAKKQRNINNNAKNIRAAADIASKTNNPYAKAIGTAVKTADKFSGGKASEKLGKQLNTVNKLVPGGRMMQKSLNKMSESGATDRIQEAVNKKNSNAQMLNKTMASSSKPNESSIINEAPNDQQTTDGSVSFEIPKKVIVWGLIAGSPVLTVIVFCCLFISASQIYLNSVGIGGADSVSGSEAEDKINNSNESDWNEEIEDIAYLNTRTSKSLNFMSSKIYDSNLSYVNNTTQKCDPNTNKNCILDRENNEVDLEDINDYYYEFLKNPEYDELDRNIIQRFFLKLYYIQRYYRNNYGVYLDMPLLMSTLRVQSSDMELVFKFNIVDYDISSKESNSLFAYDHDWSNYVTTPTNSAHDIEVLVQNMVSKQVKEFCVDSSGKETQTNILRDSNIGTQTLVCGEGETYKTQDLGMVKDDDKYREFLKQFIEKKYFLDEEISLNSSVIDGLNNSSNSEYIPNTANGNWREWRQCSPSWENKIVPKSNDTMCKIGCLITSVTIQIAKSGTHTVVETIDPGIALDKYSFSPGGLFHFDSTTNLAPNFHYLTYISLIGMSKSNISEKLASYDPNRYYIILSVSRKELNSSHHYVAMDFVDTETGEIYMIDPYPIMDDNKLYSSYKLYHAYIYEKKD